MGCIAYCDNVKNNCTYYNSPIKRSARKMNITQLNQLMGLPNETKIVESIGSKIKSVGNCPSVAWNPRPDEIYTNKALRKIRGYYWSTPKPFVKNPTEIAIHIRRAASNQYFNDSHPILKARFLSNKNYVKIIDLLQREYPKYSIT
eukprot:158850_1